MIESIMVEKAKYLLRLIVSRCVGIVVVGVFDSWKYLGAKDK